jgi:hypothetical protein
MSDGRLVPQGDFLLGVGAQISGRLALACRPGAIAQKSGLLQKPTERPAATANSDIAFDFARGGAVWTNRNWLIRLLAS